MKRLALKFGGTSVGTIEKIKESRQYNKEEIVEKNNEVIAVVSAMSGVTNESKRINLL